MTVKDLDTIDARIDEDGHQVNAVLELRGVKVSERVPRQVLNWDDERQLAHMDSVTKRLRLRLQRKLARDFPEIYDTFVKRGARDPERIERLRSARAQMAEKVRKRAKIRD